MAKKKRASSRSRLLNRAVKAGQKSFDGARKQLRARLERTASQVDLERALKRLEGLSKQVQQIARSATSRPAAPTATRRSARRPATRKSAAKPASATAAA